MQNLKVFFVVVFMSAAVFAQKQKHSVSTAGIKWVKISTKSGLKVTGYDKDTLSINIGKYGQIPKKAAGLKLVTDEKVNTDIGFYVEKQGDVLYIKSARNNGNGTAEIFLPKKMNVSIEEEGFENVEVSNITGEIELASLYGGEITIKGVTGPITANTQTSNINIEFASLSQQSPMTLFTMTGDIDVSVPANTKCNLAVDSSLGEFYSDLDIVISKPKEEKKNKAMEYETGVSVKGTLNGGGVSVGLRTETGNVFLRKK